MCVYVDCICANILPILYRYQCWADVPLSTFLNEKITYIVPFFQLTKSWMSWIQGEISSFFERLSSFHLCWSCSKSRLRTVKQGFAFSWNWMVFYSHNLIERTVKFLTMLLNDYYNIKILTLDLCQIAVRISKIYSKPFWLPYLLRNLVMLILNCCLCKVSVMLI